MTSSPRESVKISNYERPALLPLYLFLSAATGGSTEAAWRGKSKAFLIYRRSCDFGSVRTDAFDINFLKLSLLRSLFSTRDNMYGFDRGFLESSDPTRPHVPHEPLLPEGIHTIMRLAK